MAGLSESSKEWRQGWRFITTNIYTPKATIPQRWCPTHSHKWNMDLSSHWRLQHLAWLFRTGGRCTTWRLLLQEGRTQWDWVHYPGNSVPYEKRAGDSWYSAWLCGIGKWHKILKHAFQNGGINWCLHSMPWPIRAHPREKEWAALSTLHSSMGSGKGRQS